MPSVTSLRLARRGGIVELTGNRVKRPRLPNANEAMKVAAIYDIHGNLPALEAVLAEIRRLSVELVIVGGDVLPGPMPRETLDVLRELDLPKQFIRGNGDREVVTRMQGTENMNLPESVRGAIHWNAEQLQKEDADLIATWPLTLRLEVEGLGAVLFCHATPRNDTEIFTRLTTEDRLAPVFAEADASLVVCGHTHMQFDRTIGKAQVMNAGSVGMPFGQPGADWLLLESTAQLRHTGYDLDAAAARIKATAYPQAEQFAAGNVIRPPSEAEMLERFAAMELG
jgi:putative phosphoesterase